MRLNGDPENPDINLLRSYWVSYFVHKHHVFIYVLLNQSIIQSFVRSNYLGHS